MTSEEPPGSVWRRVARANSGDDYPQRFAALFDELAASGQDVHGEASFVAGLVRPGGAVLDAGCGTGRIAARLHELGFDVTGVDVDASMVAVAADRTPAVRWVVSDLATVELGTPVDLVVMAGNVVPFISPGALPAAVAHLAGLLRAGGLLVAGFGVAREHLPPGVPVVPLAAYEQACAGAGLTVEARYDGWDGSPFTDGGYAVTVHRRPTR